MRNELLDALDSLGNPEHQERVWIRGEQPVGDYEDSLDLNIHVLYDDVGVLPDPLEAVGDVILEQEVDVLRTLGVALDALIEDLGDRPDVAYLADPRWQSVVSAAAVAAKRLRSADGLD